MATVILNGVSVDVEAARKAVAEFDAQQPKFKVGDWAVSDLPSSWNCGKATRVVERPSWARTGCESVWRDHGESGLVLTPAVNLRHATPDEIAIATRIVPKVGMLLENTETGSIWQVQSIGTLWSNLVRVQPVGQSVDAWPHDLTTTRYAVRDSVTIQGVR